MTDRSEDSDPPPSADGDGSRAPRPHDHSGDNRPAHSHHDEEVISRTRVKAYWAANVRLVGGLLAIWFAVSFGAGILLVDQLNAFSLSGFPLGFWFAQQGSILTFIALIFFYARHMHGIDRRFGVDDDDEAHTG